MDYDAALLPTAFTPGWFTLPEVEVFCEALQSAGIAFVFYGGAVRDAIAGEENPKDIDILVNADAESLHAALTAQSIPAHITPHGKVMARIGEIAFDLFVRRPYEDADAADWLSPRSLREKALHLDFSVNTLMVTPAGELYDFFGALPDIAARQVRFVIDPMYSITRGAKILVRYFRFLAEYGTCGDAYTLQACRHHKDLLAPYAQHNRHHVRSEMLRLLSAPGSIRALSLMQQYDVLSPACGMAVKDLRPVTIVSEMREEPASPETAMLRLMALLLGSGQSPADALESFSRQLDLPEELASRIASLLKLLPCVQSSMTREKRLGLIDALDTSPLEMLLVLRSASEGNTGEAQALYLQLMQQFSHDGYVSPHMANAYVRFGEGGALYSSHDQYGFTLIELSIVLVIIGLVVGGVLVGQDLIHAAEIRATVSQLEKYNAAVNTFRGKYACLPGDCLETIAQSSGLTTNPNSVFDSSCTAGDGYPGDGNGIIGLSELDGTTLPGSCGDAEMVLFWQHLKDASLFSDTTAPVAFEGRAVTSQASSGGVVSLPAVKFAATAPASGGKGVISVFPSQAGWDNDTIAFGATHMFWITANVGNANVGGASVLSTADAYAIDKKIDDGLPVTGSVLSMGDDNVDGPSTFQQGRQGCITNVAPYTYNTSNKAPALCSLVVKAAF